MKKQAAACTATELRARAAPVVGTSFLLAILRRGYSRAFPRQARIACGNNYLTVKIRKQSKITTRNHPHSERLPKKQAAVCTATELRARAAPVVGTTFLLVISRRGYSRAFPRQARIACGNNYPTVKIRKQSKITTRNHPHSERLPKNKKSKTPSAMKSRPKIKKTLGNPQSSQRGSAGYGLAHN